MRWKRWLAKLHRLAWLLVVAFLAVFLADALLGLRTLSLRIAFGITLLLTATIFVADWLTAWRVRVDRIGLAHLVEKRFPGLSERLVTLVQIQADKTPSSLAPLLQAETAQQLAHVDPHEACPLSSERKAWTRTVVLLGVVFVGLSFVPAFGYFIPRFFGAWTTPLVPYEIHVTHGNGYALRGGSYAVEATWQMLDDAAEAPTVFELLCTDEAGATTTIAMGATPAGRFAVTLNGLRQPLRCQVRAGEAMSSAFELRLIDAPILTEKPSILVVPPPYLAGSDPKSAARHLANGDTILEYSRMFFSLTLDRWPDETAVIRMKKQPLSENGLAEEFTVPMSQVTGPARTLERPIIAIKGTYQAEVVLSLEHGLSTTLPLGEWTVHDDLAPRFTQPLRLQGGDGSLSSSQDYRIAPGDALKLKTVVEDNEGLGDISIEFRINDEALPVKKWLNGRAEKKLVINDWLPLPSTLKEKDRVQFRLHASDNRRLKKGEMQKAAVVLPAEDLLPQVTFAPSAFAGENAWITLRVDQSVEYYLKQQVQAQSDELRDVIGKIKKKLHNEIAEAQQLQRSIHLQSVLNPVQLERAEKLRAMNDEITSDLQRADERFGQIPELANLAEHFLEIAETDMVKSAASLKRVSEKDRSTLIAEKELEATQEALLEATKKLERMLDWDKLLAEDRLDQFEIEKLLKRQNELAERLKTLLNEPLNDVELARQLEAIRQEQGKIAEQTTQLQEKSRLVQESLAAVQQQRLERLAQAAEQLAAQQQTTREVDFEKQPAEAKDRLSKLAERQAELARQAEEFAKKNEGPDGNPAQAAADALKKPLLDEAIQKQKDHEKQLQAWLGKLEPVPVKRDDIKDATLRARVEKVEEFAREQEKLRKETERLLADSMKAAAGNGKSPLDEKTDKLAGDLLELAQKAGTPEAKAMAKESAQALEQAKKAMDASQEAKAKGDVEKAKMMDDEAGKQLEIVAKKLAKLAQDQMSKDANPKTAETLKESSDQMRKAEANLPANTKDAQAAMKSAAKSLEEASQQAAKQSASKLPLAARNPTAKSSSPLAGGFPSTLPRNAKLEPSTGKAWGELPGELKTQMLQDVRSRFGAEYAEMIRLYFERLAETPSPVRKEQP